MVEVVVNNSGYKIDGKRYRRVTTVLGCLPKDFMGPWVARLTAEHAWDDLSQWIQRDRDDAIDWLKGRWRDKRDDAAQRGTDIHTLIEALVNNEPEHVLDEIGQDLSADANRYVQSAMSLVADLDPKPVATEITVVNDELGYAGTFDFLGMFNALPDLGLVLGDWKTGEAGRDPYPEWGLQLAAYRYAEWMIVNGEREPMRRVDSCVVGHVTPEGYDIYPVDANRALFEVFRHACGIHSWKGKAGKAAIGKPLNVREDAA